MVRFDPADLAKLFPRFLERGTVLHVEKYPFGTESRDKYLVLLNLEFPRNDSIYHVLTTSQVAKNRTYRWFHQFGVVIPKGTINFFPLETAILCREVRTLNYKDLEARYADSALRFVGKMSAEIMVKIDTILRDSPYISPVVRNKILPL